MDRRQFINLTGLSGLSLLLSFDLSGRLISTVLTTQKGRQGFALGPSFSKKPPPINTSIPKSARPNFKAAQVFKNTGGSEVSFDPPLGAEYTVRTGMNGANNQTDAGLFHEYSVQCDPGMLPELTFEFSGENPLPAWSFTGGENADEYYVRLIIPTDANEISETLTIYFTQNVDGIDRRRSPGHLPRAVELLPNYPNPFNNETVIRYQLNQAGQIRVEVLDLLGRRIKTLFEGFKNAGSYSVRWDGKDDRNQTAASGTYILRLSAGGQSINRVVKTGRMVMVK